MLSVKARGTVAASPACPTLLPGLPCRIKAAMVDSANEQVASLKRQLADAQAAAAEARAAADEAEDELAALRAGEGDKLEGLRYVPPLEPAFGSSE